jgi:hypothetical protein
MTEEMTDQDLKAWERENKELCTLMKARREMCDAYSHIVEHYVNSWNNNSAEIRKEDIEKYPPDKAISTAMKIYQKYFIKSAADYYARLHLEGESGWTDNELTERFKSHHEPMFDATVAPIMEISMNRELHMYYSVQTQICSIQQSDPNIVGFGLRTISLLRGNFLAAPSVIASLADFVGVGPQSDRLDALLKLDSELAKSIQDKCEALNETIQKICDVWEKNVTEEVQLTATMTSLYEELEQLKR